MTIKSDFQGVADALFTAYGELQETYTLKKTLSVDYQNSEFNEQGDPVNLIEVSRVSSTRTTSTAYDAPPAETVKVELLGLLRDFPWVPKTESSTLIDASGQEWIIKEIEIDPAKITISLKCESS